MTAHDPAEDGPDPQEVRTVIDILRKQSPDGLRQWPDAPSSDVWRSATRRAGWQLIRIKPKEPTKRAFLNACAKAFDFPSYFGGNWDALADCLSDVAPESENGTVIVWRDAASYAEADPAGFDVALQVMSEALSDWERLGKPVVVVLTGDDRDLGLPEFSQ